MILPFTPSKPTPTPIASRRRWLKGFGALLGSGILTAPYQLLAQDTTAAALSPAAAGSAQVGGDEYIGMVKMLTGITVPSGWTLCDGRLLTPDEHPVLFALLSTTYGGNGTSTFALPKLQDSLSHSDKNITPNWPSFIIAIKVANAPATTTAVAELRLPHHRRKRPTQSAF